MVIELVYNRKQLCLLHQSWKEQATALEERNYTTIVYFPFLFSVYTYPMIVHTSRLYAYDDSLAIIHTGTVKSWTSLERKINQDMVPMII